MAADKHTSLSVGVALWSRLQPRLGGVKVYPVVTTAAKAPYVVYALKGFESVAVKDGRGADSAVVEVMCCAAGYDAAVTLAEDVRAVLDNQSWHCPRTGLTVRRCLMEDASEAYAGDVYITTLTFEFKL